MKNKTIGLVIILFFIWLFAKMIKHQLPKVEFKTQTHLHQVHFRQLREYLTSLGLNTPSTAM